VLRVLADLASAACALVFLAAVAGKLDSWGDWSRLSHDIPGGPALGRAVRIMVPVIESIIVVLCFASPIAGLAAAALVLGGLAVAVRDLQDRLGGRECNCFGAIAPATISPRLAARNAALAAAAAAGLYAAWRVDLQTLSLLKVLVTVLVGAILLALFQYRRLRQAVRTVRTS
jgi:hypothetical protein